MSRLYLCTPIYYVNGDPHIGHAHTTAMADVLVRMARMRGSSTFLSTGTDEHGQKNQEAAQKSGLATQAYLDGQSKKFQDLADRLGAIYDVFARTSAPRHVAGVQEIERRFKDAGLLIQKHYRGLYCVGCEQFKKESDLDDQGRCVDHLRVPEEMNEFNWFLRIEPFRERLLAHLKAFPEWIQPQNFHLEVVNMLSAPLEDLCISRPKSRVSLGVPLPFDSDYVTYVWFDALINYLTNVGWPDPSHQDWWPFLEHLIGKDILKTHCVYWPIMLFALGVSTPRRIMAHSHWVAPGGQKMSKSLGNVVDPHAVMDRYGVDALRFYLAKNMRVGSDSQISFAMIDAVYHTDLVNKIGNLFSRVMKFCARHFDGRTPERGVQAPEDVALVAAIAEKARAAYETSAISEIPALAQTAIDVAEALNARVNDVAPWLLIKDPHNRDRVAASQYALLDGLRLLFEMISPVMPEISASALLALGAAPISTAPERHVFAPFLLPSGARIDADRALFPRVVTEEGTPA